MSTITQQYGATSAIRDTLRAFVGHVNETVLVPDSLIDSAMTRVTQKVNADFPYISFGSFPTVADQQEYEPLANTDYNLRRVFWPMPSDCRVGGIDGYFGQPIDEIGTRTLAEPSSIYAIVRQMTWLKKFRPGGAMVVNRSVYLDPVPSSSGTIVFFSFSAARFATFGAISDEYVEPALNLAQQYLHESLGAGAGAITNVTDRAEGTSITIDTRAHLLLAKEKRIAYASSRPPPLALPVNL